MPERVCIGVIVGVHGVRGVVRVKNFAEDATDITTYGPLEDEAGKRFTLKMQGQAKGVLLARIDGIDDRNAAEALKGTMLYVPREALPAPEENEFYHADLIGLRVEKMDGFELGTVLAVHDFGAGDLIDVRLVGSSQTVLLPFNETSVPVVDLEAGRLVVDPMPGLLDEEEEAGTDGESGADA
ncbi:MAG: ribosome maturation factor RimM [Alphaproteobacteria bacterium]|nr:ribosome maturation factor RimM [Alphaproteobacteria bacterium]